MELNYFVSNQSPIGKSYMAKPVPKNVTVSLEELKSADKLGYGAMSLLKDYFYPETPAEDFNPILVTQKGGAYSGVYGPVIAKGIVDGKPSLMLCAGLINVPLAFKKERRSLYTETPKGRVDLDLIEVENNGYKNPHLSFSWELPTGNILNLFLGIKIKMPKDQKVPDVATLKSMLLDGKIFEILMDPPSPQVQSFAMKNFPVGAYKVVGYRHWVKDGDASGSLLIEPEYTEDGLPQTFMYDVEGLSKDEAKNPLDRPTVPVPEEGVSAYCNGTILDQILMNPVISKEVPAILKITSAKVAKNGGVSLQAGLILGYTEGATETAEDDFDMSLLGL